MGILTEETVKPEAVISIWTKAIRSEDEPEVAAAATESLAKLMLASIVTEDDILKSLVETYFLPQTSQNDPLKQALSYFFPVYCHSVPDNQYRMARVRTSEARLTLDCRSCDSCTAPGGRGSRGRRGDGVAVSNRVATRRLD